MFQTSGRILLLANGHPPGRRLWAELAACATAVCCVDGGADSALRLGVTPSAVFGDFDSASPAARQALSASEWVETSDQEFTDLDKALACLADRGARDISIAGGLGRRADHSLSNLALLLKHRARLRITFHSASEDLFLLDGRWSLPAARRGRRVSLIPLFGRVRITTAGLKFPLTGEYLEYGVRDGISNEASGGALSVEASVNPVLVCVGRSPLNGLVFAPGSSA